MARTKAVKAAAVAQRPKRKYVRRATAQAQVASAEVAPLVPAQSEIAQQIELLKETIDSVSRNQAFLIEALKPVLADKFSGLQSDLISSTGMGATGSTGSTAVPQSPLGRELASMRSWLVSVQDTLASLRQAVTC